MDILILNWKDIKNPDVGGAEIILLELARRLVNNGHTVTWFSRAFTHCQASEIIDGINVIRRGSKYTVYWEAYRYYSRLTKKPDRVLDCINTICWQTPLYIPKKKRIAYVNQLAREVFFYELPPIIAHLSYLLEPLEYMSYKNTRFVCYAKSVKQDITKFGVNSNQIKIFPIGLDHSRYKPAKKSIDPLFVFVARLANMKRPEACIEAMSLVTRQYKNAKLAIIGYGPLENYLAKKIQSLGLSANVFLVNKDNLFFSENKKDMKVKLMQQAWALLLPSVKEGWGMVVTEAAACGTPSIVTHVTGLVDSVQDEKTGLVIPDPFSSKSLASAMHRIISDTPLRIRLSQNAEHFAHTFSWDKSYMEFLKIITNI